MGGEPSADYTFQFTGKSVAEGQQGQGRGQAEEPPCFLDVFLPPHPTGKPLSAILYFHGGGLTVGNRRSYFPHWLHDRALHSGYAFLNADYTLLCPSTGHDVLTSILTLFTYLSHTLNADLHSAGSEHTIAPDSIVVSGSSAGGYCAYLAALHASPKPRGVLSMYGMGGDLVTPQYLSIKTQPFFMGREILSPTTFREFMYPFDPNLEPTCDSSLSYYPAQHPTMPGWPKNPRMQLCRVLLQEGVYLDYLTGEFEPSLSERIRGVVRDARARAKAKAEGGKAKEGKAKEGKAKEGKAEEAKEGDKDKEENLLEDPELTSKILALIGPKHVKLFPQFLIDESFPPTYIVHGELDSGVRVGESRNLVRLLERNGNGGTLRVVRGEEHSFDYASGAYEKYGEMFDEVFEFVDGVLK